MDVKPASVERRKRKKLSVKDFSTLEDLQAHIAKERRYDDRQRLTDDFYKKRRLRTVFYIITTVAFSAVISVLITLFMVQ